MAKVLFSLQGQGDQAGELFPQRTCLSSLPLLVFCTSCPSLPSRKGGFQLLLHFSFAFTSHPSCALGRMPCPFSFTWAYFDLYLVTCVAWVSPKCDCASLALLLWWWHLLSAWNVCTWCWAVPLQYYKIMACWSFCCLSVLIFGFQAR